MSNIENTQAFEAAVVKIEQLLSNFLGQLSDETIRGVERRGGRLYLRSHIQTYEPDSVTLSLGDPFDNGMHDGFELSLEEHAWNSGGEYLGRQNYWTTWVSIQCAPEVDQPMSFLRDGLQPKNFVDDLIQRYSIALHGR